MYSRTGRIFVAIGMAAFGIHQLAYGTFVRCIAKLPAWVPLPALWPYVTGVVFLIAAAAIASRKHARPAATLLGAMLLAIALTLHSLEIASNPSIANLWVRAGKVYALSGAAFLAGSKHGEDLSFPESLAPWFLAVFLMICGIAHGIYAPFVKELVPSWIPARLFWTYFTGAALLAGGVGILIRRTAHMAALLSGAMIFSWVIVLHVPRAFANLSNTGETNAIFEALAISGMAFLVADLYNVRS